MEYLCFTKIEIYGHFRNCTNSTSFLSATMNAPDRFELFILPDGVKKYKDLVL